jgi:DNA-binding transcriptional LysR family regulator
LEIGRLRALLELARSGTMAAAAEALFLTPSAVSQQIAQLEEEAGVKLTERIGRGVRLTPAGHALVAHAERLMVVMDEARSEMAELRREIAGELRVAAFPSIASVVLPETVNALRRAFPRLEIVIEELEAIDGVAALRSWRTDIALIDDLSIVAGDNREHVTVVPLAEDVWYATLSTNHPLSKKPSLSLADLKDETWAMESRAGPYGSLVADLCRRAGFEPRTNAKCRGSEMVEAMVASGCSVSVAPGLSLTHATPGGERSILRPELRRKIYVAYRRGERNHPMVKVFVDEIVQTASRLLS